jgi:c-di-GMP-binding flagellar brake protein YcgR
MRAEIEAFIAAEAARGERLEERAAIVRWMDRHYDDWFKKQLGIPDELPGEKTGIERRRHPRYPVELSAFYRVLWTPTGDRFAENDPSETGRIENISAGGLFIVTGRPYPISTLMEIQFDLPSVPEPVAAFAMVVWRHDRSVGRYGHGLHFSHIETTMSDRINEAIMEKVLDAPVLFIKDSE